MLALFLVIFPLAAVALFGAGFISPHDRAAAGASGATGPTGPDWHAQYVAEHRLAVKRLAGWNAANRKLIRAHAQLRKRYRPVVAEAINLSCTVYGYCATLWRKARCESNLNPLAQNGSSGSAGLFQFLPSTWRGTPFGRFSIWSPYANALAAGWMHQQGRGGEWVCQ